MIRSDEARIALEQAQIHWQAQEWQLTIESCAKALALDQTIAQAHKLMGDALQKTGKVKEAIGYYKQAIAIQPGFAKVYVNLGSLYANQKQWQQAVNHYQQALTIDPELLTVHQHLVRILQLQRQQVSGEFRLDDYLEQGNALKQQGKLESALEHYQRAVELAPQKVEIYRELASLSERLGKWQDAAKYCRLVLQLSNSAKELPQLAVDSSSAPPVSQESNPTKAEEYLELAHNLIKEGKYKSAIAYYHRAIEKQPKLVEAYLGWAELLTRAGAREQAIACYLQGLKQVQDDPELYYRLGHLYNLNAKWSQAAVCYQKATQYAPSHAQAHHELGEVLSKQEQWSDAILAYRQAIKYNPNFSWSYNNLGYALIQVGQWEEAIPAYHKAIELNPDFPWSYYNLAEAYGMIKRWSSAIDFYQQAAQIQPDLPKVQQKIGNALYNRGLLDKEKALECFSMAISQDPQDPQAYHQALALDKNNLDLYLKLGEILVQQEQLDEAIATYQIALQVQPKNSLVMARLQELVEKKTPIVS